MSYQSVLNDVLVWLAKQKIEPPPEIKKKIVKKLNHDKPHYISYGVLTKYKCQDCKEIFTDSRKRMDVVCPAGHIHNFEI